MKLTASKLTTKDQKNYYPILKQMEKFALASTSKLIAIDGRCGTGKSYLANALGEMFDCTVFHMDDFFLPFEMKTSDRLAEPGGNVHYERFLEEVLIPLSSGKNVTFNPYNCTTKAYDEPVHSPIKQLTIVEGVYSLHPLLIQKYDFKICLTANSQVQKERITKRNGKEKLQLFTEKWIPLEENYFTSLNIEEKSDIVLDTSDFF